MLGLALRLIPARKRVSHGGLLLERLGKPGALSTEVPRTDYGCDTTVLTGEATRTLDERYRLNLPAEFVQALSSDGSKGVNPKEATTRTAAECLLAKERPGCLSLWNREQWEVKQEQTTELVRSKLQSGRLDRQLDQVQKLGRLLSTRQRVVPIAGRGRLVVPEGFRELLGVEPGGTVVIVGAAICVELWHPTAWGEMIGEQMPTFRELFEELAG